MNGWVSRNAAAAFFAIGIVAPVGWMLLDREPPYTRESGTIESYDLKKGEVIPGGDIVQGGGVTVDWKFKARKACPPSTEKNLSRMIVDAKGKQHPYDPIPSGYGNNKPSGISRPIALPDDIAEGSAKYRATACFACNPLQYLWPVCISQPEVDFNVVARK